MFYTTMSALTDGDRFDKFGGRVLIQDEELWPMAKGMFTIEL